MDFVIKQLGGGRAASILIGTTEESLANWKKDRVNPNFNGIKALAKAADVSLDWLAYGRGFSPLDTRDFIFIPYADFEPVGKKPFSILDDGEHEDFSIRKQWVRAVLGIAPEKVVMTIAAIDSMDPTVRIGDILLVDTGTTAIAGDGLYLLRHHDTTLLRRVQTMADGTVILKADNPAYTEERLSPDQAHSLAIIGLIAWIARRGKAAREKLRAKSAKNGCSHFFQSVK